MKNYCIKWPPERIALLTALFNLGLGPRKISLLFNTPQGTIAKQLEVLNLDHKDKPHLTPEEKSVLAKQRIEFLHNNKCKFNERGFIKTLDAAQRLLSDKGVNDDQR